MHYDDAVRALLPPRPEGTPVPESVRLAGPARRLRDAAEHLAPVADRLLQAARRVPSAGRPLYDRLLAYDEPADSTGRLHLACDLVREARGDAHVAVAVSAGLGPVEMNVMTEVWNGVEAGGHTATRGWDTDDITDAVAVLRDRGWYADGTLTAEGRQVRHELEAATDVVQWQLVEALGDELDDVVAQLTAWGERCVQAGVFPADVLERACG